MIARSASPPQLFARKNGIFFSGGFSADPLTSGVLAVTSIFAAVYGVQAVICALNLSNGHGHRAPYAALLLGIVFEFISYVLNVVLTVITNWPDRAPTLKMALGLTSTAAFFDYWFIALTYLSIALFIADRRQALQSETGGQKGRGSIVFDVFHGTFFLLLFTLGTAVTGTYTNLQLLLFNGGVVALESPAYMTELNNYTRLTYVFDAFWYLTAFDVIISAFMLSRAMRNAGVSDKITNIVLYAVAPLYTLRVIVSLIFTILYSPRGLQFTFLSAERANLADTILASLFYASTVGALLVLGARRANWHLQLYKRFELSPSHRGAQSYEGMDYDMQKPQLR